MESRLLGTATIRHKDCELVVEGDTRCKACKHHRSTLHAIYSRIEKNEAGKENRTAPTSHVNYRYLSSPEKSERLSRLHQAARTAQRRVSSGRLQWQRESTTPLLKRKYLEQWETAVAEREHYTVAEKKTMLLSQETSVGLKLTGMWATITCTCVRCA